MPKAFVQFEVKGTRMTLASVEQFANEVIKGFHYDTSIRPIQQIKLLTVTYDQKGTIGRSHGSEL